MGRDDEPAALAMTDVMIGSGNVYADLGFDDAGEQSLKATLAHRIASVLHHRNLTQSDMGALLGIPQPKVSRLLSGKLDGFSVERLIHFILRLDRDVEITIRKRSAKDRAPRVLVRDDRGVEVVTG